MMVSASPWLAGVLFVGAGAFQFTPWKTACLLQCANPLALILAHWREGVRGAIVMGLRHGLFCLGCCWALMLLLFAFGVMNVTWIVALTLYVLLEKLAGRHAWLGRIAGAALGAWGFWTVRGLL
jgi:predicted metal-binding membrane protein